jgi:predicted RNA-binding Zn-ribbon protein involved in translation (DUF1610 family)
MVKILYLNVRGMDAMSDTSHITNETTNLREATNITNPTTNTEAITDIAELSKKNVHQTGEQVIESGAYFCDAGAKRDFAAGEMFPLCPVHGNETVWRHAEHEHKTGDPVKETAHYYCTSGQHLDLKRGDTFPVCPNTGENTLWKHAE